MKLKYTSGCKYQVAEDLTVHIPELMIYEDISYGFLTLSCGELTILKGFAWDGASGITFDTKSSMRASCVHDALYQLIRQELLPPSLKHIADKLLLSMLKQDSMWEWRANAWYMAVDKFADAATNPKNKRKVKVAP